MLGISIAELENKPDEELSRMLANQACRSAWPDIQRILENKRRLAESAHREAEKASWATLQQRVERIESKIPEPTPERRTWAFRFGVAGFVLAVISLALQYFGWTYKQNSEPVRETSASQSTSEPIPPNAAVPQSTIPGEQSGPAKSKSGLTKAMATPESKTPDAHPAPQDD